MSSPGAILSILVLIGVISVGGVFAIGIFAEEEQAHNMTNSSFEAQYNSTVDQTVGTLNIVSFIPYILAVVAVIVAFLLVIKYVM